jgi:hypothetical protein
VLDYIKHLLSIKRVGAFLGLVGLVIFSLSAPLSAQSVTQGYSTDKVLQRGTLVSIDAEDTSKVQASSQDNQERLHGVVVGANDSPFTLSDENEKTFVATVGRFDTLVSTEAGVIQPGDFLTISNITGIAMKAGEQDLFTVGKAIEGFDGQDNKVSSSQLKDGAGNVNTVAIGRVLVDVGVGSNPLLKPAESNLPGFLKKATEAIAGKQVSPVRVYIGAFILLAAAGISGSLLYSGIKSSVISIGRNPLSKKSITKSLMQIILTSIIIFLIGLFGVYLLLRL